ncbi:MAG: hypothetical protein HYX51_10610 [Chloroflexi bacterium]|nr:hypothetical protein [Chloroflexota bacterium]
MTNLPPDYTPTPLPVAPRRRRGGRRSGAGAPKGNLNALRHGRRSRFRDLLTTTPDTVALAGRLLARERRVAERHATTLMRMALLAQHRRAYVTAVEQGLPLPQPPLIDIQDLDIAGLLAYMERVAVRTRFEEARKSGALTPEAPSVATARATFTAFESFIPVTAAQLDTALRSLPSPAALAAVLTTPNNQTIDQPNQAPDTAVITAPESAVPSEPTVETHLQAKPKTSSNQTTLPASGRDRFRRPGEPGPGRGPSPLPPICSTLPTTHPHHAGEHPHQGPARLRGGE